MRSLISRFTLAAALAAVLAAGAAAQSSSQDFPTPVTGVEVSGTIKARDLGDSRLTTLYYILNGEQGDLFLNLVTRNFTGDIDVFTVNGLRPMTKIVVYADYGEIETGRAIYLRKAERLLLRIQGRTPNDDDAAYRVKFAGSFVPMRPEDVPSGPDMPKVTAENRGAVRVNSVGTIIPPPPRPSPEPPTTPETRAVATEEKNENEPAKPAEPEPEAAVPARPRAEVILTDTAEKKEEPKAAAPKRTTASRRRQPAGTAVPEKANEQSAEQPGEETSAGTVASPTRPSPKARKTKAPKKVEEPKPDPLESITLVVLLKNGTTLEKKMSEVFKFGVDKGVLTVILKGGSVIRYPIVEVARLTIE